MLLKVKTIQKASSEKCDSLHPFCSSSLHLPTGDQSHLFLGYPSYDSSDTNEHIYEYFLLSHFFVPQKVVKNRDSLAPSFVTQQYILKIILDQSIVRFSFFFHSSMVPHCVDISHGLFKPSCIQTLGLFAIFCTTLRCITSPIRTFILLEFICRINS